MSRIQTGTQAPDFEAPSVFGGPFKLSQHRDRQVLLAFHRYASCPVCNFSLRQFMARADELRAKGIDYVPVFHSTVEKLREYYPDEPPFPMLSNPDMSLYRLYGLTPSIKAFLHPKALRDGLKAVASIGRGFKFGFSPDGEVTTRPADFLIDTKGVVRHARYGESLGDSLSPDEVLRLV